MQPSEAQAELSAASSAAVTNTINQAATAAPRSAIAIAMQMMLADQLREGEIYVGTIVIAGVPQHHVVLLPGDVSMRWGEAMRWAAEAGGELPTRAEQALLFANARSEFKRDYYWSSEQHAANADYAWYQVFNGGIQNNTLRQVGQPPRSRRPQIADLIIYQFQEN